MTVSVEPLSEHEVVPLVTLNVMGPLLDPPDVVRANAVLKGPDSDVTVSGDVGIVKVDAETLYVTVFELLPTKLKSPE
jgi:hypothetical protein